jgi:hypothetical protein
MQRTVSLVLWLLFSPGWLVAQSRPPILLEVSVGATSPTPDLVEPSGGSAAPALGIAIGVRVTPRILLYGGYSGYDLELSRDQYSSGRGVEFGGRLYVRFPEKSALWLGAGVLSHTRSLSFPASQNPDPLTSSPAWGRAYGLGLSVPVLRRVTVSPSLHYRTYTAEFDLRDRFEGGGTSWIPTHFLQWDAALQVRL